MLNHCDWEPMAIISFRSKERRVLLGQVLVPTLTFRECCHAVCQDKQPHHPLDSVPWAPFRRGTSQRWNVATELHFGVNSTIVAKQWIG